jgi:transglutaminase-like putative cysteine protease
VVVADDDGTVSAIGESLDKGDSYDVDAYVPQPTPAQMRAAPLVPGEDLLPYVPGGIASSTELFLPGDTVPVRPNAIAVGARGRQGAIVDREVLNSPYARVWKLSRRLARGQPTAYDVVRSVQNYLRREYIYDERPPRRDYPLAAFLFRDKVGYCQHFSGAMALMLRILGIPARVAAGFTPGSYNADTKEYRVRDLDAHSWVEVWFTGVGWVPFDPTPSVAPADSQSSVNAPSASGGSATAGEAKDARDPAGTAQTGSGDPAGAGDSGDAGIPTWVALAALALLAAGFLVFARVRAWLAVRRRADDPDVATLTRVLARTGEPVSPRLTLSQLESRLEQNGGQSGARYVRMLRERRFGARGGEAPDAAAKRDLRRALTRGRSLRIRLALLAALPPVSFRRS